jgi:hypothetical protein
MKKLVYGLIILLSISCNENPKARFSLIGNTGKNAQNDHLRPEQ